MAAWGGGGGGGGGGEGRGGARNAPGHHHPPLEPRVTTSEAQLREVFATPRFFTTLSQTFELWFKKCTIPFPEKVRLFRRYVVTIPLASDYPHYLAYTEAIKRFQVQLCFLTARDIALTGDGGDFRDAISELTYDPLVHNEAYIISGTIWCDIVMIVLQRGMTSEIIREPIFMRAIDTLISRQSDARSMTVGCELNEYRSFIIFLMDELPKLDDSKLRFVTRTASWIFQKWNETALLGGLILSCFGYLQQAVLALLLDCKREDTTLKYVNCALFLGNLIHILHWDQGSLTRQLIVEHTEGARMPGVVPVIFALENRAVDRYLSTVMKAFVVPYHGEVALQLLSEVCDFNPNAVRENPDGIPIITRALEEYLPLVIRSANGSVENPSVTCIKIASIMKLLYQGRPDDPLSAELAERHVRIYEYYATWVQSQIRIRAGGRQHTDTANDAIEVFLGYTAKYGNEGQAILRGPEITRLLQEMLQRVVAINYLEEPARINETRRIFEFGARRLGVPGVVHFNEGLFDTMVLPLLRPRSIETYKQVLLDMLSANLSRRMFIEMIARAYRAWEHDMSSICRLLLGNVLALHVPEDDNPEVRLLKRATIQQVTAMLSWSGVIEFLDAEPIGLERLLGMFKNICDWWTAVARIEPGVNLRTVFHEDIWEEMVGAMYNISFEDLCRYTEFLGDIVIRSPEFGRRLVTSRTQFSINAFMAGIDVADRFPPVLMRPVCRFLRALWDNNIDTQGFLTLTTLSCYTFELGMEVDEGTINFLERVLRAAQSPRVSIQDRAIACDRLSELFFRVMNQEPPVAPPEFFTALADLTLRCAGNSVAYRDMFIRLSSLGYVTAALNTLFAADNNNHETYLEHLLVIETIIQRSRDIPEDARFTLINAALTGYLGRRIARVDYAGESLQETNIFHRIFQPIRMREHFNPPLSPAARRLVVTLLKVVNHGYSTIMIRNMCLSCALNFLQNEATPVKQDIVREGFDCDKYRVVLPDRELEVQLTRLIEAAILSTTQLFNERQRYQGELMPSAALHDTLRAIIDDVKQIEEDCMKQYTRNLAQKEEDTAKEIATIDMGMNVLRLREHRMAAKLKDVQDGITSGDIELAKQQAAAAAVDLSEAINRRVVLVKQQNEVWQAQNELTGLNVCPICMDHVTEVLLPCMYLLCAGCTGNLQIANYIGQRGFVCPHCREDTPCRSVHIFRGEGFNGLMRGAIRERFAGAINNSWFFPKHIFLPIGGAGDAVKRMREEGGGDGGGGASAGGAGGGGGGGGGGEEGRSRRRRRVAAKQATAMFMFLYRHCCEK